MSQTVPVEIKAPIMEYAAPDPERFFRTDQVMGDLRRRTLRGGAITAVNQSIKFAMTVASTAVLARILAPSDYGLVAMVTALTGFVGLFRDMGLSMATVQRSEITHRQVSTLFWANVAISSILALIAVGLAPVLVQFNREPRLFWMTVVSAGGFIISGLSTQHNALLQRQMRFGVLAAIDLISLAASIASVIVLAKLGAGYWALIMMPIVQLSIFGAAAWVACGWRPGPPLRHTGVRSMLAFGGKITAFNTMNYFARNLDNILIGRFFHEVALGLYSRAYNLLTLPLNQINAPIAAVAVPGLSRLQNEPQRFRSYYLKALSLMTFVSMPLVVALVVLADALVLIVLGDKWQSATPLFRILGISAIVQPVLNPSAWLYIATGQTGRMFKWGLFACPVLCLAIAIGACYSTEAVAWSYSFAILFLTWPCLYYSTVGTSIRVRDICVAVMPAFVSSLVAAAIGFAVRHFLDPYTTPKISALIAGLIMAGAYLLLTLIAFGGMRFYVSAWRELRGKGVSSPI